VKMNRDALFQDSITEGDSDLERLKIRGDEASPPTPPDMPGCLADPRSMASSEHLYFIDVLSRCLQVRRVLHEAAFATLRDARARDPWEWEANEVGMRQLVASTITASGGGEPAAELPEFAQRLNLRRVTGLKSRLKIVMGAEAAYEKCAHAPVHRCVPSRLALTPHGAGIRRHLSWLRTSGGRRRLRSAGARRSSRGCRE
jgi:hypothetical protein